MAAETEEMRPWQHGIALDKLKAVRRVFEEHDKGLILGAFTAFKENAVAAAQADGSLRVCTDGPRRPIAALVCSTLKSKRTLADFAGRPMAEAQRGDVMISRVACLPGFEGRLQAALDAILAAAIAHDRAVFLELWQEHPGDRALAEALGLAWLGTKVRASSELRGVYAGAACSGRALPYDIGQALVDGAALQRLPLEIGLGDLMLAADQVASLIRSGALWADHYSSYNKRHSWSALALRGYAPPGEPCDPQFIIKPAEMSKAWRKENPETASWQLSSSTISYKLPAAAALADRVPGDKERVRLMLLEPGGGELTRHSDITDPDAGTAPGKLLRLHIPISTNPDVRFNMWELDGQRVEAHMEPGSCWYLDTRKPHTARNGGESPRLHLVMDCWSNEELLGWVRAGSPAEAAP